MNQMTIKIVYISGSRADFGRAYYTLKALQQHPEFSLRIIATSMHLSIESGYTVNEIDEEFVVDKIDMLLSNDSGGAMAKSMGMGIIGITQALEAINPDLILLLGDRGEMLAGSIAGKHLGISVAHIGGGHVSGSVDDQIRDAITVFCDYHFVANEKCLKRVISIGADQTKTHIVGAPDLDSIILGDFTKTREIIQKYEIDKQKELVLLSFHPVVGRNEIFEEDMEILCDTLLKYDDLQIIATFPNMDAGGRRMKEKLKKYQKHSNFNVFTHIPYKNYLGLMNIASFVIGNSSAGIIEAPSFNLPAINIGDRQEGRERAGNVIDIECDEIEINKAIDKIYNDYTYISKFENMENPYGDGKTSKNILKIIEEIYKIN